MWYPAVVCMTVLCLSAYVMARVRPAFGVTSHQGGHVEKLRTISVTTDERDPKVTMTISQHLVVTLKSTYWLIHPLIGDVIRSLGSAYHVHDVTCRPVAGSGCGEIEATFVATHRGTTTIQASRNSCGEALHCSAANSHWQVVVYVH